MLRFRDRWPDALRTSYGFCRSGYTAGRRAAREYRNPRSGVSQRIGLPNRALVPSCRHFDNLGAHSASGEGGALRDEMRKILRGRVLFVLGVLTLPGIGAARAENLDEGKSGRRLFADSC